MFSISTQGKSDRIPGIIKNCWLERNSVKGGILEVVTEKFRSAIALYSDQEITY
ncbi:MAG: hypothetical protein QNJ70_25810 [Xenococcaceae cyanobacterium MO_207.B15]|nr:hypothetical protein [Xenococcaceae cyanobacterium MO_207.B15]